MRLPVIFVTLRGKNACQGGQKGSVPDPCVAIGFGLEVHLSHRMPLDFAQGHSTRAAGHEPLDSGSAQLTTFGSGP